MSALPAIQLLRHGRTQAEGRYCGHTDVALTAAGWQQMHRAVAGRRWQRIVSSPLERCAAFAQRLAAQLAVGCRLDADLREMHFGRWEGASAAELLQSAPQEIARFWANPWTHGPPDGESVADLQRRVLRAWARICAEHDAAGTLVVTHGGPIRLLRAGHVALLEIEVPHAVLMDLPAEP